MSIFIQDYVFISTQSVVGEMTHCVFCQDVTPLQIVFPDTALRLQALLDFEVEGGEKRVAGDEWLFEGPGGILTAGHFMHTHSFIYLIYSFMFYLQQFRANHSWNFLWEMQFCFRDLHPQEGGDGAGDH